MATQYDFGDGFDEEGDKGKTLATFTGTAVPAYELSGVAVDGSVSCSGSTDFCFFCHFSDSKNSDGDCSALWDVVRDMVDGKKELPTIVKQVSSIYERHIRPKLVVTFCNKVVNCPEWSPASIKRHLVFSSEYPELFDCVVDQIFHSVIMKQNNALIDGDSGEVIESRRSALMDTIGKLTQWRNSRTKSASAAGKARRKTPRLAIGAPD